MKTLRLSVLLAITFLLLVSNVASAAQKLSFEDWLENYGAWDRLERRLSTGADKTPEMILKRARAYLKLGSPKKALEILEMTPTFSDPATESMRLWYGGQALRSMGDVSKSVLWFTQAASFIKDPKELKRRFQNEPRLSVIWKDVWRELYWNQDSNFTMTRNTQLAMLGKTLAIADKVWNNDTFWKYAKAVQVSLTDGDANATKILTKQPALTVSIPPADPEADNATATVLPFISEDDVSAIATALGAASLQQFGKAKQAMTNIGHESVRSFWLNLFNFLETGKTPLETSDLDEGGFLKAKAFWTGNVLVPYSTSRAQWFVGGQNSEAWTNFQKKLLAMPTKEALAAVDNELGSLLISNSTAALLRTFKLALIMTTGDRDAAEKVWNSMDRTTLPISLKLAGLIMFSDSLKEVMPANHAQAFKLYPLLTALTGAAGKNLNPRTDAHFWTAIPDDKLKEMATGRWCMDRLLLMAYWQQVMNTKPSADLAKRGAFLFPQSAFGSKCLVYLANESVAGQNLPMAAYYLNRMNSKSLDTSLLAKRLEILAKFQLASGKPAKALATFLELAKTGEPIPPMTRLRMALLMQQRGNIKGAQVQLMELWKEKDTLPKAMQAEVLFWIAEGEHAMQRSAIALDYYLRLAWQYPEENIWAITAMYRAAMIYEVRGKYETAKRLLGTVIKNADTKEQRAAAKARLVAIEKKMGGKAGGKDMKLAYPF